jgi:hypothetical protein
MYNKAVTDFKSSSVYNKLINTDAVNNNVEVNKSELKSYSHISIRKRIMRPFKDIPENDPEEWLTEVPRH